jgi:hypothetical protein
MIETAHRAVKARRATSTLIAVGTLGLIYEYHYCLTENC